MSDFTVRSDSVDVEQIMRQIRGRIRDKRGVDYTEEEIRELANVKLEKFLDPRGVRSDLLEQFRRKREASLPPNFKFEDTTLFETHRGLLAFIRRLLRPVLKLFFNPNPLIDALHIQSKLNAQQAALEPLYYDGKTFPSPGLDLGWEVTEYAFDRPGRHEVQWRLGDLVSNVLTVDVG